jgi:5,10-methylenetetrahydromethanopterin reductase
MAPPFRIGVMQLTMEPLEEILEHARAMDKGGFDTIWLAEAYPWWRKHSMEARSSTAVSALVARETERLAVGWGIISPFTRHPIQIAMEARVTQEAAGPERFYLGLGVSKIFMRHAAIDSKPVAAMKEAAAIVRGVLAGDAVDVDGKVFSAHVPALRDDADAPRWEVPLYFAGTGPMMLRASAQEADGLLTASITTPAFVRHVRGELEAAGRDPDSLDIGCTIVASIGEDREQGRDGAREIAGMYLANKVQNIQAAADTLLECAGLTQEEIRPIAEAMEQGGRLAAKAAVTDEILDKCRPIAGTPEDCISAIQEYRDAGCTHVMLELWGDDRLGQLRLLSEKVLPECR